MVAFEAIEPGWGLGEFRNEHLFNSFARPRCLAEERQTRLDRWVMTKAADGHSCAKFCPSVPCNQGRDDGFQCDPMQGIAGMSHGVRLVHALLVALFKLGLLTTPCHLLRLLDLRGSHL